MKTIMLLALLTLTHLASPAFAAADSSKAADKSAMSMTPSKGDREKMAVAHEQMATCLRSDQEFKQCHEELHKKCESMMGNSCSEMEMGKNNKKSIKHHK